MKVDEFVILQPELLEVTVHFVVVNTPEPELVIWILLPVKAIVDSVALNAPVLVIAVGLPDKLSVALLMLTVAELNNVVPNPSWNVDPDEKFNMPEFVSVPWFEVKSSVAPEEKVTVVPEDIAIDAK